MLSKFLQRGSLAALLLALLLFWAPLPAGSVTPGAELVFRLLAFAALLASVQGAAASLRRLLPAAALAGIALLGLVQSCGWPAATATLLGEERSRLYEQAAVLGEADGRSAAPRLSLTPASSRSAALSWLAAAALLAAALSLPGEGRWRVALTTALLGAALVQGGVGLARLGGQGPEGLTSVLLQPEGRLRGSFANPNHLSLFFEIALAVAAAWAWWAAGRARREPGHRRPSWLAPVLLWALLLALVVLTGSRAGLVAAVAGGAAQLLALAAAGSGRRAAVVALVLLAGVGALALVVPRLEIQRYATVSLFEDNLRGRLDIVPPALELWRRFPLAGTGLGSFEEAIPLVLTPELSGVTWNRAHNDPLELLVTGGLIGFGLAAGCLLVLLPRIWRVLRDGTEDHHRAAALAAVGALAAAGVHELMDFGLVIPANAAVLAVVVGVAAGSPVSGARQPARE